MPTTVPGGKTHLPSAGFGKGALIDSKTSFTDFEDRSRCQFDLALEFGLPAHVEAGGDLANGHPGSRRVDFNQVSGFSERLASKAASRQAGVAVVMLP